MNWLQRLDLILLALMLAHIIVVVIRVSYWYRLARRAEASDIGSKGFQRGRRKLVADLSIKVDTLQSIALVAPYLGLAGTCTGIVTGFRGVGIEAESALAAVMAAGVIPRAFITTVAGLLVAIPATWSHNYLRTRIDLLGVEDTSDVSARRSRYFGVAQTLPLAARFSKIPFPLIAAPILAILAGMLFMEYSSYETPTGLDVGTAPATLPCEYKSGRLIVLHVTNAGRIFLNYEEEDWKTLRGRLSEIYTMRKYRVLYILADDGVAFQQVADAIDIAKNTSAAETSTSLDITVLLITPKGMNARCLQPAVTRSRHRALR